MMVNKLHLHCVEEINVKKIVRCLQIILDIYYFPKLHLSGRYFHLYLLQWLLKDVSSAVCFCQSWQERLKNTNRIHLLHILHYRFYFLNVIVLN